MNLSGGEPGPGPVVGGSESDGSKMAGHEGGERASGVVAGSAGEGLLPKIIPFSSLVRCGDEVWIEHAGSLYRLRRTKQDKLILTK